MMLTVHPTATLRGVVNVPASKSYSIRAFFVALCGGCSVIINSSDCDDAKVALAVAKQLGSKVIRDRKNCYKIIAKANKNISRCINVNESGTSLRFVLPLISLCGQPPVRIVGQGTLIGRPNHFLLRTLRKHGVGITGTGVKESVPIVFRGGKLEPGTFMIDGSISSQFASALLISCPQLDSKVKLVIAGKQIVSSDYIEMTLQILAKAGIKIKKQTQRVYSIRGDQKFKGLKKFKVPSDFGLMAFLLAGASLLPSKCIFEGEFNRKWIQADGKILDFLKLMQVRFRLTQSKLWINGPFHLRGGDFSLRDCPDLVPIMAILALFAKGRTRLLDIKHARLKESDRISDLRQELLKVGAKVKEQSNALIIDPCLDYKPNRVLNPYRDHRLAMAFSILGLKVGARVKNIECINKSYPSFLKDLRKIGGKIRID